MFETQILKVGGVILYPTDTIWGLGCDATNREAIERIIQIKGRSANKNLLILVSDEEMLAEYVESIPSCARDLLHSVQTPATIIYPQAKNLPIDLLSNNQSIGIRIPKHDYCQRLLKEFGKPIVSTSANLSGMPSPENFSQIVPDILQAVDYVAEQDREDKEQHSASSIFIVESDNSLRQIR
ncbi:MAG: threonylcarbamoyl-AMP synthase [Bacteroidales bacterium]|nr:threonylcarbamoyl-AMP synthase [Bacteroidales bacterium]